MIRGSSLAVLIWFGLLSNPLGAAELKPETSRAFDAYLAAFSKQLATRRHFLMVDAIPGAREKLRSAEIIVEHIRPAEEPPHGMIHHWRGAVFIRGAQLESSLSRLQDYDQSARHFKPEVIESRLLRHEGSSFLMRQRWKKKKVITVILETEHQCLYRPIDATRAESSSYTTKISEVENAGQSNETLLPPGQGEGFIWRMNTYWRYLQADGGLYVEIDAVSLSRSLPPLIGGIIRPIVEDLPEQSLRDTLANVRKLLAAR